jgi:hypothetical protein
MRHSLFLAILLFAMSNVFAQTEKEAYKAALWQIAATFSLLPRQMPSERFNQP